jgi:hypothetical protein
MRRRHLPQLRTGRTLAGATAALIATALMPALPAAAAPDGWPPDAWPTCTEETTTFCVDSAILTPLGGEPTAMTDLGLTATATGTSADIASLNWAVDGWAEQSPDVLGGDITLVLRTGPFVPRFTSAVADGMRITRTVDDNGDYTMTITGHAAPVDWTTGELAELCDTRQYCGDDDQMADEAGTGYRFAGNTQDLSDQTQDFIDAVDGAYIASDAQARTPNISYTDEGDPHLSFGVLGNPHLDSAGNPVRGSFNAWVPAGYFATLETTPQDAVDAGFDVVNNATDVPVSLPATATVEDDGVAFTATGIGYGMNMIDVYNRPSGVQSDTTVPGTPQNVDATADTESVTTQWTAPDTDGGMPITGYAVRAFTAATGGTIAGQCAVEVDNIVVESEDGGDDDNGEPACAIDGLTDGELYYVAVSASNALGEGDAQPERLAITAGAADPTPPSAPTEVRVSPGAGRLVASWHEPDTDNGAEVTGYTARAFATRKATKPVATCTAVAPARTCPLPKLANGVTYYLGVTATNDAGEGPEQEVRVAAAPRTVPGAPRSPNVTSKGGKVKVGWAAPTVTGGAAVTSYRAAAFANKSGGTAVAQCTGKAADRACSVSGLKAGRTYYVAVTAVNAAGSSVESGRIKIQVRR